MILKDKTVFGGYLFDGTQMCLTRLLDDAQLNLISTNHENVEHRLKLQFTKQFQLTDNEYIEVINLILRRVKQGLQSQHKYLHSRQFNIERWSEFQTSIRQYKHGLLMNVHVSVNVCRTETVYDLMEKTPSSSEFKQKIVDIQQHILLQLY